MSSSHKAGIKKGAAAMLLAIIFAAFLPAAAHASGDNQKTAGRVPQVLKAVSDKKATSGECTLGNAVADAARVSLGSDAAIVFGGDLVSNLLPGEITWTELKAAFAEDRALATAVVSPKELCGILEVGFSRIVLDEAEMIDDVKSAYDGFPQISGFTVIYDASAQIGRRVYEIVMHGERLALEDETKSITLAAPQFMLDGGHGYPSISDASVSELTLSGAFARYLGSDMPEYRETELRIYPIGLRDDSLSELLPAGLLLIVIFVILLGNGRRFRHMFNFER